MKKFRDFESAREFVRSLGFTRKKQWNEYCQSGNKPADIPNHPASTYNKKGWINMGTWLGIGNVEWRNFKEAREFVQKLGLKNHMEWRDYCKSGNKPDNIPSSPWQVYKEWKKK